jgi:hypothetical protein
MDNYLLLLRVDQALLNLILPMRFLNCFYAKD